MHQKPQKPLGDPVVGKDFHILIGVAAGVLEEEEIVAGVL